MIKYVLFDFDGTMAVELYNDLADKYRYEKMAQNKNQCLTK